MPANTRSSTAIDDDKSAIFEEHEGHPPPKLKGGGRKWGVVLGWWTYLHRLSLGGLVLLFILLVVALEILNFLSHRDRGFVTATEGVHYLWRYGPTFGEKPGVRAQSTYYADFDTFHNQSGPLASARISRSNGRALDRVGMPKAQACQPAAIFCSILSYCGT